MALVATVFTALFSAQGSGAAESDITLPTTAETETPARFISEPVIQSLPANGAESETDPIEGGELEPASLTQLVAQQAVPDTLDKQMRCLASAIYFEARGESLEGQLAVGRVIVNRAQSGRFPSSYCGVVYQPSQFSFVRGNSIPSVREGSQAWRHAVAIARIAAAGGWTNPAKDALFFHATHVSPRWKLTRVARVDSHVFYR